MDWTLLVPEALQPYVADPRVLSGVYFVLFLLLARLTDWIFSSILIRIAKRSATDLDDRSIALLHRPVFFSVVLIGVFVALDTLLGERNLPTWVSRILMTVAIVLWGVTLSRPCWPFSAGP